MFNSKLYIRLKDNRVLYFKFKTLDFFQINSVHSNCLEVHNKVKRKTAAHNIAS